MTSRFALLSPPLFALTLACQAAAAQTNPQQDTTYFYSAGTRVPLRIATDRVAIRLTPGAPTGAVRSLMQREGRLRSEEQDVDSFPDQQILILPLQQGVTRAGYDSTLADLRDDPVVEFVGTVALFEQTGAPLVLTDELVVEFNPGVRQDTIQQLYARFGLESIRSSERRPNRFVLRVLSGSDRDALRVANALYETGLVQYAHPNFIARTERRAQINPPFTPNDPLYPDQWHLNNTGQGGGTVDADVDAPEAWAFARGDTGVLIAVLDDAIQFDHPDIQPNVVAGRDFTASPPDNDPSPAAGENHGTAVTGVAAARGNNTIGVSGSCPSCGILAVRMLGGSIADHADAFDWAAANGAWVITNSWGYDIGTPATDDVVDAITDAAGTGRNGLGSVIFFAMTNTNVDNCVLPTPDISAHDSVIAVSRSTNLDQLGNGGFGDCMEFLAPTRDGTLGILTTDRTGADGYVAGDYYDNFGGTSSATPLSAGIGALVLSINPNLTRMQVQRILEQTADKIDAANAAYDADGFSSTHGYGRVNAHRAVVPTVKISVSPRRVGRNEPFDVTVTGSAPHGLQAIWWFGQGTGIPSIDQAHMQNVGGEPVFAHTWTGIRIGRKGTFRLGANARDVLYPNPGDGYPHQASEGSGIAETTVRVPDLSPWGFLILVLVIALLRIRMDRRTGSAAAGRRWNLGP